MMPTPQRCASLNQLPVPALNPVRNRISWQGNACTPVALWVHAKCCQLGHVGFGGSPACRWCRWAAGTRCWTGAGPAASSRPCCCTRTRRGEGFLVAAAAVSGSHLRRQRWPAQVVSCSGRKLHAEPLARPMGAALRGSWNGWRRCWCGVSALMGFWPTGAACLLGIMMRISERLQDLWDDDEQGNRAGVASKCQQHLVDMCCNTQLHEYLMM